MLIRIFVKTRIAALVLLALFGSLISTQVLAQSVKTVSKIAGGFILTSAEPCRKITIPVSGIAMQLCMQAAGNLVLYNGSSVVFASNFNANLDIAPYTGSTADWTTCATQAQPCFAEFQTDGNLVLYNPEWNGNAGHSYWNSGTSGHPGATLNIYSSWLSINDSNGIGVWPQSALSYSANSYFVKEPTFNSVAWDQVQAPAPGGTNLFVGRQCDDPACGNGQYIKLIVAAMNWSTHALTVVNQNLFAVSQNNPIQIYGGYKITTAYDPTLLWAHGELWVTFECGDRNSANTGQLGAVACMGPIATNNDSTGASWRLIAARTTVVVKNSCDGTLCHSASAPKIFFWHGLPYMYYTAVHMSQSSGTWTSASTRGILLQNTINNPGGLFWAANNSTPINSVDANSTEVMQVDSNDPLSNQIADGFGVYPQGPAGAETSLIMTGALGGNTNTSCVLAGGLNPASEGCYRQFIAKATTPLGKGIFNIARVSESQNYMPSGLSQYVRRFYDNNGQSMVWGAYSPAPSGNPYNKWSGPSNSMWAYPLNLSTVNFQPTSIEFAANGQFNLTNGARFNFANGYLLYQSQGNLVLYNSYNKALWTSPVYNTSTQLCSGEPCATIFQTDGNLVQYQTARANAYWYTATGGMGSNLIFGIRPDYYHVGIQNRSWQWVWGQF